MQEISTNIVINKMTKAQYESLMSQNQISDTELYYIIDDNDNFYFKNEVYNKTEIDGLLQNLNVNVDLSEYYTKTEVDGLLENVSVDLTDYYTKTETDELLENVSVDLSDYYTKTQTDTQISTKVSELVNSAPDTLDTLGEIATALQSNSSVVETLNSAIANKADKSQLDLKADKSELASKADRTELFSKSYNDLTDKPNIPDNIPDISYSETLPEDTSGLQEGDIILTPTVGVSGGDSGESSGGSTAVIYEGIDLDNPFILDNAFFEKPENAVFRIKGYAKFIFSDSTVFYYKFVYVTTCIVISTAHASLRPQFNILNSQFSTTTESSKTIYVIEPKLGLDIPILANYGTPTIYTGSLKSTPNSPVKDLFLPSSQPYSGQLLAWNGTNGLNWIDPPSSEKYMPGTEHYLDFYSNAEYQNWQYGPDLYGPDYGQVVYLEIFVQDTYGCDNVTIPMLYNRGTASCTFISQQGTTDVYYFKMSEYGSIAYCYNSSENSGTKYMGILKAFY